MLIDQPDDHVEPVPSPNAPARLALVLGLLSLIGNKHDSRV